MLAATLIASANDAANVLAVHRSGSLHAFVRADERRRRPASASSDTHYSNPSGIFDAGNHSSAWDVADLSRHVLGAAAACGSLVGRKAYQAARRLREPQPAAVVIPRRDRGQDRIDDGRRQLPGGGGGAPRDARSIGVLLHVRGDEFAAAGRLLDWGFRHDR